MAQSRDGQVGAVLLIDDEPVGLDVFDNPRTLQVLLPTIVRGYALDAIDRRAKTPDKTP